MEFLFDSIINEEVARGFAFGSVENQWAPEFVDGHGSGKS